MKLVSAIRIGVLFLALAFVGPTAGEAIGCLGRASAQTAYLCAGCGCAWRKDEPECVEERRRANMTPEQRMADDAARQRREAEQRRRAAAEAERLAAERARKVDAISEALGPGRRAGAERLQSLDEEAAKYRPKAPAAVCTTSTVATPFSVTRASQVEAIRAIETDARNGCGNGGRYLYSASPSCKALSPVTLPRPKVGDCLACASEQLAKSLYGWDPVKGYPPQPEPQWSCEVTLQCEVRRCTGSSAASRQ